MKDYSYLKGTEVKCVSRDVEWKCNNKLVANGFVADIDYDKGITIKCLDTQKDVVCLNSQSNYYGMTYHDRFMNLVKSIESGTYKVREFNSLSKLSLCAFE